MKRSHPGAQSKDAERSAVAWVWVVLVGGGKGGEGGREEEGDELEEHRDELLVGYLVIRVRVVEEDKGVGDSFGCSRLG